MRIREDLGRQISEAAEQESPYSKHHGGYSVSSTAAYGGPMPPAVAVAAAGGGVGGEDHHLSKDLSSALGCAVAQGTLWL